ncbi:MAG: L-threonylcarbamoyladenylate synthase [Alphaproteobacteria bacterium]
MKKVIKILNTGGVIIFPTDTIYGIGCDARNKIAVEKVFGLKKREKNKPVSVFATMKMIEEYCILSDENKKFIEVNKQNPLTYILQIKEKKNLSPLTILNNTIGIRLPNSAFLKELFSQINFPIVGTSANIADDESPTSFEKIKISADIKIKGDEERMTGSESTIIDLRTKKIIRQGEFKL